MPASRLTNYMFAHSKYSYGLGRRSVLTDLLIEDENAARQDSAGPAAQPARAP
jgi:hypothetical protein